MAKAAAEAERVAKEEAERPAREAAEREHARQAAERAREEAAYDARLFDRSPIIDWFPDTTWTVLAHTVFIRGTVFECDDVKLLIEHPDEDRDDPITVRWCEPYKQHISQARPYHPYRSHLFNGRTEEDWWGPCVAGPVDIDREINSYEERTRMPSGPGWWDN